MTSYKVEDDFLVLKEFTTTLPDTFDHSGLVIQDDRNVVKKIVIPQGAFAVKDFKGMYFFNRLAYSIFRKSKAIRSYEYSNVLKEKGIITPPPVAWIDCYKLGLLMRSFFVSVYFPQQTLDQALQSSEARDPSYKIRLLHAVAAFVLRLHRQRVYHYDLSAGNLLVMPTTDGYDFALVDLNRIRFREVSYEKGLRNFSTLKVSPEDLNTIIREYALLCGQSPEVSIDRFWLFRRRSSSLRKLRKKLRSYTLTPFEKMFARHYF